MKSNAPTALAASSTSTLDIDSSPSVILLCTESENKTRIIDSNNSISYQIDHDSEYEDVFSNITDNITESEVNNAVKITNSENRNKKKRKDEYFSKFNNNI